MKKLKKGISFILSLALLMGALNLPVAAVVDEDALMTQFVESVYNLSNVNEFIDAIALFKNVNDPSGLSSAYAAAFGSLGGTQQARIESFGVTTDLIAEIARSANNYNITASQIQTWLTDKTDENKASFRAFAEHFKNEVYLIGDSSKIVNGFAQIDKVFSILGFVRSSRIENSKFLRTDREYGDFAVITSGVDFLISGANVFLANDITANQSVYNAIGQLPAYYNSTSGTTRQSIYNYLNDYAFVSIVPVAPAVPSNTNNDSSPSGVSTPLPATETLDILDTETPEAAPNTLLSVTPTQMLQLTTSKQTEAGGVTTNTVTINSSKQLMDLLPKDPINPVISFPVSSTSNQVIASMQADIFKDLSEMNGSIQIHNDQASYTMPAIGMMENMRTSFGATVDMEKVKVNIEIANIQADQTSIIRDLLTDDGYKMLVPPVSFKAEMTYEGQTVQVENFPSYVERRIAIPADVDASKITTAVVVEKDGTLRQVPTQIMKDGDLYYAVIMSRTNSVYVLIDKIVSFNDTNTHWAKNTINNMASRLIIDGVGNNNFAPDRLVTRAEVSSIIVRALGLQLQDVQSFSDVKETDWFYSSLATAKAYGITAGYTTGEFKPTANISRQEAMIMIANAMKVAGMNLEITADEVSAELSAFGDAAQISTWAKNDVALVVKSGLVTGYNGNINPSSSITRAELITIIERLLQNAKLI